MTAVIQTEKLTKSYGNHRGIIDVDLEVDEGEAFGFLGPNGAGKTTMIRTLLDHIRPTSGRATIFGIDTTVDPVAIHRRIGYLPGEFVLYNKLTGGQTLEYFANLRGGVDRVYQQDLIARLDVDPSRKFREYSKGNKQKIGLIIALQHRPDLLLLDEPTSGLDPLVQQEFYGVIREAKAEGRTVFLSSHILSEVEKTCDRVAIIREGRLARVDRTEALRDLAHHTGGAGLHGPRAGRGVQRAAGRLRRRRRGPHPAACASPAASRPVVRAAAQLRAGRLRQPRAVARGDLPGRVRPHARRGDASNDHSVTGTSPSRAVALEPHLRLRQRLRQDRPRLAPRDDHRRRRCWPWRSSAWARRSSTEFNTPQSRAEIDALVAAVPPILQGLAGKVVNVGTLGGYFQYKYGIFFPLVSSLWSILALSGTLAGEAARGSLEFVAVDRQVAPAGRHREAVRPRR